MVSKNQKGQALILTIIVTVASLIIGAGAARRAIRTQKQSSFSLQAAKAQKFADAGVEHALTLDLDDLASTCPTDNACVRNPSGCPIGSPCALDVDGDGTNDTGISVAPEAGQLEFTLQRDETRQLTLVKPGPSSIDQIRILWNGRATIVYSIIHKDRNDNVTLQQKGASDPDYNDSCSLPGSSDPPVSPGSDGYEHQIIGNITPAGSGEELYLRVRPLCENNTAIKVEALAGGTPVALPTQGHKITSVGTFGEASWTVEVTKMNPALPSLFDYAIFSEQNLTK